MAQRFNFRTKENGAISTRAELPNWSRRFSTLGRGSTGKFRQSFGRSLNNTATIRNVSTSRTGEYDESDIMSSGIHREPATLDYSMQERFFRDTVPVDDEPDVLDWMLPASSMLAHMSARANEYNKAGSNMAIATGDPKSPGVSLDNISFRADTGATVAGNGNAILNTPNGTVDVPVPGSTSIVQPNVLGWAAAPQAFNFQWLGAISKVRGLTINPSSTIGFPNVSGLAGPVYLQHQPSRNALRNDVTLDMSSSKSQTVTVTYRDVADYTNVITTASLSVPEGRSTSSLRLLGLGLPPMVAEIQPEDQARTQLHNYSVVP